MIVKKIYRLTDDRDFKQVLSANHVTKNRYYVVYHLPNQSSSARIGISVSKKLGNAVIRNRIRRQVRAMFDATDIFAEAFDIIVIVRLEYKQATFQEANGKLLEIIDAIRRTTHE